MKQRIWPSEAINLTKDRNRRKSRSNQSDKDRSDNLENNRILAIKFEKYFDQIDEETADKIVALIDKS